MPETKGPGITRIVVATGDEFESEQIVQILSQQEDMAVVGIAQDGLEAAQMAVQYRPDVALMDLRLPEMDGFAACEAISLAAPQVATVLMSEEQADAIWRQAMRAGAKDVLGKPLGPTELLEALRGIQHARAKQQTREFRAIVDPSLMPRVIAVAGAKGGVGKTTLATNMAVALAQEHRGETVLVDLYSQFGDVALMLNLQPKRTMLDMAPLEDEIDRDLVEAHLTAHDSGLKVLVGSNGPAELTVLSVRCLSAVLGTLRRNYRFMVLDVPPMLYDTTRFALTHATAVVLVANLFDLTTLNDTRKLYQLLTRDAVPKERIHLVLNRVARSNRLQAGEIERTFGRSAAALVPNAAGLAVTSVNEGVPFVLSHPEAPVARSIRDLARRLSEAGGSPPAAGDAAPTGRLKSLIRRP